MKKHKWKLTHGTHIDYLRCEDCLLCIGLNERITRNKTDCDEEIARKMKHRLFGITSHLVQTISIELFKKKFTKMTENINEQQRTL